MLLFPSEVGFRLAAPDGKLTIKTYDTDRKAHDDENNELSHFSEPGMRGGVNDCHFEH